MSYPASLQNHPTPTTHRFNADGYGRWMTDRLTIVDKEKNEVPLVPQPAQLDLLQHMQSHLLLLVLKARKMGFSSVCLAVAVAKFLNGRNEKCVSVSFDQGAAEKQLARAKHYIKAWERITGAKVPLKYNSKNEMVYEVKDDDGNVLYSNTLRVGSARSGSFGRGDDITFLHITEVSFADDVRALLAAVGEAVIKDSHIILETTANGFNSYKEFWDASMLDETGFAALFYSPEWEYDDEFLASRRQKLGRLFKQEYPMTPQEAFITSGDSYFDVLAAADYLQRVDKSPELDGHFRHYRRLQRGEFIVAFADTAAGGTDYCAVQFISQTNLDVPIVYHAKVLATEMTPQLHTKLEEIYAKTGIQPVVSYERNNGGVFEIERLARLNKNGYYTLYRQRTGIGTTDPNETSVKLGWDTNSATRPRMLQDLKECVDNQMLRIYDERTVNEMFSFIVVQTSSSWKAQAENGAHDDLIMSLAGAWQMYQSEVKPEVIDDYYDQPQAVDLML